MEYIARPQLNRLRIKRGKHSTRFTWQAMIPQGASIDHHTCCHGLNGTTKTSWRNGANGTDETAATQKG